MSKRTSILLVVLLTSSYSFAVGKSDFEKVIEQSQQIGPMAACQMSLTADKARTAQSSWIEGATAAKAWEYFSAAGFFAAIKKTGVEQSAQVVTETPCVYIDNGRTKIFRCGSAKPITGQAAEALRNHLLSSGVIAHTGEITTSRRNETFYQLTFSRCDYGSVEDAPADRYLYCAD